MLGLRPSQPRHPPRPDLRRDLRLVFMERPPLM